jgi:hypothetical protein
LLFTRTPDAATYTVPAGQMSLLIMSAGRDRKLGVDLTNGLKTTSAKDATDNLSTLSVP